MVLRGVTASDLGEQVLQTSAGLTQKVAAFVISNKSLLFIGFAATTLAAVYTYRSYYAEPTVHFIPSRSVAKPFKWENLHYATTMKALMNHFDAIEKNIDQQDLEQYVHKTFSHDYCAGKCTSALTLYFMLQPDKISLQRHFVSQYAIDALNGYIEHKKDGSATIVDLMPSANHADMRVYASAGRETAGHWHRPRAAGRRCNGR